MAQPTAKEAFARLREGNERFASGLRSVESFRTPKEIAALAGGQQPFAIIVACSDSRVPVETVFDQGPGDLFVIRLAGNVITPAVIGSVEFAAAKFGTPLAVVMGHTRCGAIDATVTALHGGEDGGSPNIQDLVDRVKPAVREVMARHPDLNRDDLIAHGVRANVRRSAEELRTSSMLSQLPGFSVVEALYELETGKVELLEHLPEP